MKWARFRVAFQGICAGWKAGLHFKIHTLIAITVVIAGFLVKISRPDWILITGCIGAVLSAELFNTALEILCNRVVPQTDPMIKKVKDIAAGAVLVIALGAAIIGGIVFYSYIL